jgi:hypothetical protein
MAAKRRGGFKIRLNLNLERDSAIMEWFGKIGKRQRSRQARLEILKAIASREGSAAVIHRTITLELYLKSDKESKDSINSWLEATPRRLRSELLKDIFFRVARPVAQQVSIKSEGDKAGKAARDIFKSIFSADRK